MMLLVFRRPDTITQIKKSQSNGSAYVQPSKNDLFYEIGIQRADSVCVGASCFGAHV